MGKIKELMYDRQKLIDAVIESLRADILEGDVTVLEELLGFIEKDKLVQSLPEERWLEFRSSSDYFSIKTTGYNPDLEREEIQINCGENGNLMIVKTDEGFVVDAYDVNGENLNTMQVWEDDMNPLDEDESPAQLCFSPAELREFKDRWGQTHDEICANLNVPDKNDADDILMLDYFFEPTFKKWFPKLSSMYNERQEAIAKFLRHKK
jgi:hypothetical protein